MCRESGGPPADSHKETGTSFYKALDSASKLSKPGESLPEPPIRAHVGLGARAAPAQVSDLQNSEVTCYRWSAVGPCQGSSGDTRLPHFLLPHCASWGHLP